MHCKCRNKYVRVANADEGESQIGQGNGSHSLFNRAADPIIIGFRIQVDENLKSRNFSSFQVEQEVRRKQFIQLSLHIDENKLYLQG